MVHEEHDPHAEDGAEERHPLVVVLEARPPPWSRGRYFVLNLFFFPPKVRDFRHFPSHFLCGNFDTLMVFLTIFSYENVYFSPQHMQESLVNLH